MKTVTINGVEIEEFKIDPNMDTYLQGLPSKLNQLLEALDEKKEELKPNKWCEMFNCDGSCKHKEESKSKCEHKGGIRCWECGDVLGKEEPKSEEMVGWVKKNESGNWENCHFIDAEALMGNDSKIIKTVDPISKQEEPKSTLKEEIWAIVYKNGDINPYETTDKIISLFKGTLLEQIDNEPDWNTLTKFIKNL